VKILSTLLVCVLMFFTPRSRADMFGGDVIVLGKILVQTIQQLAQLRRILRSSKDELNLLRTVNQGINDSLNLMKTLDTNIDPGVFKNIGDGTRALKAIEKAYGKATGKDKALYENNDRSVSEAISFNNQAFEKAQKIDLIGEEVKESSHSVSPGGAQKLTAQAMGVLLHVENTQLRAQAKNLKIQAQRLARENKRDKDHAHNLKQNVEEISRAIQKQKKNSKFQIPRF